MPCRIGNCAFARPRLKKMRRRLIEIRQQTCLSRHGVHRCRHCYFCGALDTRSKAAPSFLTSHDRATRRYDRSGECDEASGISQTVALAQRGCRAVVAGARASSRQGNPHRLPEDRRAGDRAAAGRAGEALRRQANRHQVDRVHVGAAVAGSHEHRQRRSSARSAIRRRSSPRPRTPTSSMLRDRRSPTGRAFWFPPTPASAPLPI